MLFRSIFKRFSTEEQEQEKKTIAKSYGFWFILLSASSFLITKLIYVQKKKLTI